MSYRLALPLLVLAWGCTPLHYTATAPPRGTTSLGGGSASASVVSAKIHSVASVARYRVKLSAPPGSRLGRAYLTGSYQPRCSGDAGAILIRIDGEDRWQSDPVEIGGHHELELDFMGAPGAVSLGPRAIDLELSRDGAERCLRVELRQGEAAEAGWEQTNDGDQAFATDIAYPLQPVAGVTTLVAFRYELGLWAGPARLSAQPGPIGFATCSDAVCGERENGQPKVGPSIPLGLSVTTYPWQSGIFALGVEARLREALVWLPAKGTTERFFVHAPQAVIHLTFAPPLARDGLPGGPRVISADLELGAGAMLVRRDGQTLSAPMVGLGFSLHTWL